jgi:membrane protease YdiL (CAAX protease family)
VNIGVATPPTRRSVVLELAVVTALAALFVLFFRGRPGYIDVALGLVAVGLIGASTRRSRDIWRRIRQLSEDQHSVWRWMLLFTTIVASGFLVLGLLAGYRANGWQGAWDRVGNWHLLMACVLYFPWALLQQFVFQFYMLGRLRWVLPYWPAIIVTAVAYSAVHFPRTPVMIGTVFAGVIWAATYYRYGKLLPLAVSHAVLGSTLHYWVFGRDLAVLWF